MIQLHDLLNAKIVIYCEFPKDLIFINKLKLHISFFNYTNANINPTATGFIKNIFSRISLKNLYFQETNITHLTEPRSNPDKLCACFIIAFYCISLKDK